MIFAASSYEEILAELDAGQANQNTRLQSYREVYDCLKLPLFLLPCNETGCSAALVSWAFQITANFWRGSS